MKTVERVKIESNGEFTEVELNPCFQCKLLPTLEDAKGAVAHERATRRGCAICGGQPKLYPKHALYHSGCGRPKGGFILCGTEDKEVDPEWHPDWASVYTSGPCGTIDAAFHIECLKRVAPGVIIHPPR